MNTVVAASGSLTKPDMPMIKRTYDFTGIIQGVGFRPCIARLAQEHCVSGSIQNRSGSVRAEFVGADDAIEALLALLETNLPPLARIDSITLVADEDTEDSPGGFRILDGVAEESRNIMIPADVAICPDCMEEINDPADRRYRYPFTTCVNCGPRYTVITGMPYERPNTTMVKFPLCSACNAEYTNAEDRRFHAESTCCPDCGPQLSLLADGKVCASGKAALAQTQEALADGKTAAIKGIGGFLLAVDPKSSEAVARLRERKDRPHKPLAVMARDIEVVRKDFELSREEERLLLSPQAPIVILRARENKIDFDLNAVSPDTETIGVMLPTSPLHLLLLEAAPEDSKPSFDYLVMTSGNKRSEPICLTTEEALDRLSGIADIILTHDRDIALRNDDSLCIVNSAGPQVWRRGRGFAPSPISLRRPLSCSIIALGSEIKNTIAVGYDSEVVLSPHIGDLETPEAVEHMNLVADRLPAFLGKDIEAVAVDLNPDMHSSIAGRKIAQQADLPVIEIQHHEAHALACLAENGLERGFAFAFDGTGLGPDGTIWGSELFYVDGTDCTRVATYRAAPLPGGDKAVREPVRQLIARLIQAGSEPDTGTLLKLGVTDEQYHVWKQQIEQNLNCPQSSGAGRLFDAMAVATGCAPSETTYEGQPAIRLEALALKSSRAKRPDIVYAPKERDDMLEIDWAPCFKAIEDIDSMRSSGADYAMALHKAVIDSAIQMLEYGLSKYTDANVGLSGGVLMNRIISDGLTKRLQNMKLTPLMHSYTPPNDGCISLGQVVRADCILRSR